MFKSAEILLGHCSHSSQKKMAVNSTVSFSATRCTNKERFARLSFEAFKRNRKSCPHLGLSIPGHGYVISTLTRSAPVPAGPTALADPTKERTEDGKIVALPQGKGKHICPALAII